MKAKLLNLMQRVGRSLMLPIAVLPIAGIFLGLGTSLSNEITIASLQLEWLLGRGTFLNTFFMILTKVGSTFFENLPLIFAASVALGMAKKEKGVAVLSAIIAFIVMHTTISGMLTMQGVILDNQIISTTVLEGSITPVLGTLSLQMGVFGGIIVGLGVSFLHNRYYQIKLPSVLSFFEGERFIPIIATLSYFVIGILMFYIWPFIQNGIYGLGQLVLASGYFGTFIYGLIERLLVPFGLHHVFYLPFWQTGIGGSMVVNGVLVQGGQNIFFAQLADPSVIHFSSEATKYFTGKFLLMIFGLPGATLAMYHCAKPRNKKRVKSLLVPATCICMLTGITEPIEFSFLFISPLLFIIESILAGMAYMITHILNITIGLTFSGGIIDFVTFGILQGNDKTNWVLMIPLGIVYFLCFYFIFKFVIKKYRLNIPEIETINKILQDKNFKIADIDKQSQGIVKGLGGRENFCDLDSCITRLRATIIDPTKINEGLLKQAGAAAIVKQGDGIQIIFGPQASSIKTAVEEYLISVPDEYDDYIEEITDASFVMELGNVVDGEVLAIEESCDPMFSHKLLGDGIMIKPDNGLIVAPCNGVITMVYPAKHALGLQMDNGMELLLHFGVDTVRLNGSGFEVLVNPGQRVAKGDILWNVDLEYVIEQATSENILLVITKQPKTLMMEKRYGHISRGDPIIEIKNQEEGENNDA